jgi:hypothetical protein
MVLLDVFTSKPPAKLNKTVTPAKAGVQKVLEKPGFPPSRE